MEYTEVAEFALPKRYQAWMALAVQMEKYVMSGCTDPASLAAQRCGISLWGTNDLELEELNRLRKYSPKTDSVKEMAEGTYIGIISRLYTKEKGTK